MAHKNRHTARRNVPHKVTRTQTAVPAEHHEVAAASTPVAPRTQSSQASATGPSLVEASVKYARLPGELRWVALVSVATLVLLIILWFILR